MVLQLSRITASAKMTINHLYFFQKPLLFSLNLFIIRFGTKPPQNRPFTIVEYGKHFPAILQLFNDSPLPICYNHARLACPELI